MSFFDSDIIIQKCGGQKSLISASQSARRFEGF